MTDQQTVENAQKRKKSNHSSTLLGVSKWFRHDWNFAISVSRVTSFASIATILSISAFVLNEDNLSSFGRIGQLALLTAIGCYLIAFFLIKAFAPRFLQEYPFYKVYEDQKHSHRWIVWSFIDNFETLKGGAKIAEETITKGISCTASELFVDGLTDLPDGATQSKIFSEQYARKSTSVKGVGDIDITLYKPEIYIRDIYLGIEVNKPAGVTPGRYILSAREADDKLNQKVKELFWIIFTEAARHKAIPRIIAWMALYVAAVAITVFIAVVLHSALAPSHSKEGEKEEPNCICKCELLQSALPNLACVDPAVTSPGILKNEDDRIEENKG